MCRNKIHLLLLQIKESTSLKRSKGVARIANILTMGEQAVKMKIS